MTATWRDDAACRGSDPRAWTLPELTTGLTDENRVAIRICRGCPVRVPCARYALNTWPQGQIHGGVPIRCDSYSRRHERPSERSIAALRQVAAEAA